MTIKEAAAAWGITERRVNALCKAGRISGAYKEGRRWFIPDSTQKPVDKRGHRSVVKPAVSSARKPLPIGVSDYRDACKNYYYVDKTLMIKEFLDERPKVSLFTRPRRFGKTLNMDMLRTFFEKTTEDTSVYFRDKKIWSCGESYLAHHRKYPVIFLSFKDVKYTSWEETYQTLQKLIAQEFRRHDELASSSALSDYEKEEYSLLATEAADEVEYQMSLRTLTLLLHKHHNVAPIVIIDEYDTPIQQGHVSGFYDTIIGFMRNLFSGGLKDNPHLSYGFLTGILRVAKESIFSGLNNLKINSILDERYSEYFGFTSSEVHEMADYYHASDKYQELCEWYDGYLFGNTEIFNPWSVIGYFNNNCRPKAFWQSTGSNDIIREVLASATPDIMERLELLMKGESFVTHIDTGVIYPQIQNDPSSVYSFLLVAGYLKAVSCDQSYGEDYMCEVALPNKEISFVYSKEILSQLENIIPRSVAIAIQEAIYKVDSDSLQKTLEKFLLQTISFHDAADETFYHGLILGMCAVMDNSYRITSNREAGDGRFDIQMLPLNKRLPGILIELKAGKDRSETQLEDLAKVALQQINDRAYSVDLQAMNVTSIIKIGIAFSGKRTRIAAERQNIETSQIFAVTHSPFVIHNDRRRDDKVIVLTRDATGNIVVQDKPAYFKCTSIEAIQDAFSIQGFAADKPTVYLEGRTDEKYFKKALEVFGYDVPFQFKWVGYMKDAKNEENTGKDALNKAAQFLIGRNLPIKNVCLFDCDTSRTETVRNNVYTRVIPTYTNSKRMKKGIENALILDSVDVTPYYSSKVKEGDYGDDNTIVEFQKMDFCEYICSLDSDPLKAIFANLKKIIDMLATLFQNT